ncbi:ribosomal L7Ae/L30e/S12e/Gadd45 family protein [Candidatus Woesearchaeota archaeon]|nr:ribosomal L7Ae/L30e/S12e/Gadd45 family protein [Candidatus Woesearchaeota archaeon]
MAEVDKEVMEQVYKAIETARTDGKISKGVNETTKAVERGDAKLVAFAGDVSPPEIVMHLPDLSKEKGIPCVQVGSKVELGAAAGLKVGTTAVAVVKSEGAKKIIDMIKAKLG